MNAVATAAPIAVLTRHDDIAVLRIDSPPVNALGLAVRRGIADGIGAVIADPSVRAVVLLCAGRTFFAGADISEFGKSIAHPDLNDLAALVENAPKPVIAAIHGMALGGGLELALACHYRVALRSARIGLPEVNLGLIPGAGGTQRVPRLAGFNRALQIIGRGEAMSAAQGAADGLIDLLVDDPLEDHAVAYARRLLDEKAPLRRARDRDVEATPEAAAAAIQSFVAENGKAFRGFRAAGFAMEALEAAVGQDFDAGLAREQALFEDAMATAESAAQRHIFFAERAAAKIAGIGRDVRSREIASATIVGAGTMGRGIATAFVNAGLQVTIVDRDRDALDRGVREAIGNIEALGKKKRLAQADVDQRVGLLNSTTDIASAIGNADLVVEAVYEDLDLKTRLFVEIDALAKPGAILASNTSFLDLDAMAAATRRPQDVIGLHFFSPAHVMRLLEVVRGTATADDVIVTGMKLGGRLGKLPVLSRLCNGFIANRIMRVRSRAAETLLLEGATPWDIDEAMVAYGFPMGEFAMLDLVGLDVIGWDRAGSAGRTIQEVLCEAGRWGRKNGAGYYDYGPDGKAHRSPLVERVVRDFAVRGGRAPKAFTETEIVERLLYPTVNEASKVLEEGIAQRASDIDVALVAGYGWPSYRGGPLIWADFVGLGRIVTRLDGTQGATAVSPLLRRLAEAGGAFTQ